ncbi:hypothetical protein GQF56_21215 [Rhodobacter sphaeroides]|jgi:hypothetical protein|uniref:Type II CBASS E2 protein domain-containing protein n=1 Tax=Cereibacter sphaeroides (strain ATCC 17023 / DSM 158 / JCM 6121 / CCUG 31486 / LMG 2827 / NBRC 12203 / NCIMB 8253 / ATH 2.4.1.) TaxID=272943 RepID=Q3IUU4_CERS4|nr:hypothetical protein [Cereibacter sphaeroides]ABA81690.1 hypothetical protein RSP_4247 [Cereibacter sphaeroides 2.4.1]AMJ49868.1 hypothetical protein APX01_20150 [Cereibacter sphaeroides]AMJ50176.1 hypothetical protein APX01_21775 [Cereibacter sphaeroides]ANS36497.1 hypothetical protein A3858_19705 [Cereibacter sphaeroides]ATN65642.1 hypothetical protein A3857_20185 [Cereibacter sphaeroides]
MKPRRLSLEAQIRRMRAKWPEFRPGVIGSTSISWMGPLRGFQMDYTVLVRWSVGQTPKAIVVSPQLRPRVGTAFIDIPHLILDVENPEDSPLCLFDPEAGEWNDTLSVADTILPWASEWLHNYELWHLDGVWRGPNAPGPISIGDALRLRKECLHGEKTD